MALMMQRSPSLIQNPKPPPFSVIFFSLHPHMPHSSPTSDPPLPMPTCRNLIRVPILAPQSSCHHPHTTVPTPNLSSLLQIHHLLGRMHHPHALTSPILPSSHCRKPNRSPHLCNPVPMLPLLCRIRYPRTGSAIHALDPSSPCMPSPFPPLLPIP